jgi:hypothetical protein
MKKQALSFVAIEPTKRLTEEEDQGYDVPFATFTWERWLQIQASTIQCFARFQRAVEQGHVIISHEVMRELQSVVLEMQGIVLEMQKEADGQIGIIPVSNPDEI